MSRGKREATTLGLASEQLESRRLLVADMIAVAGGTLPTASLLAGKEVSAFQIGKYEVTWGEWQEVSAWGGAEGRTYDLDSTTSGASASHPVENVSWYDAVKWCNAKSEKDGLQPVYTVDGAVYRSGQFGEDGSNAVLRNDSQNGYRLPARAEWEWAARGGASSQGYSYSGGNTLSAVAWYVDNSDGGTKAVGTKAANELGLYDMSGNVAEWCWNEFTAVPVSLGNYSYVNGGSWADNEFVCSFESPGLETTPDFSLPGLRLARNSTAVVNNAPTSIALSAASIAENQASGTAVGTFSTTDPDAGNTFTYALVAGTGDTDNLSFTIDGSSLETNASFDFEAKSSYTIRVRTTDQGNASFEKQFTITVTNVNDAPTVTAPASFMVTEDVAGNIVWPASQAAFADVDSPSLTVTVAVDRGTLAAATAPGIKLGSIAGAQTFAGTPAALNAYFSKAGSIKYTSLANDTGDVGLLIGVFDGTLSALTSSTISITPVNDAPTMTAPASFMVTEDVAGNLVWPASPAAFADVDSPSLTVTLAVADGTLTAAAAQGITLGGTATARTITGSPADLNGYFKAAGNITYTTAANNTVARTLTTTVSDGTLSTSKTSTISITPVNDAPTATAPASFTVTEDVAGNLVWPTSPAAFADVDSPAFTVTLAVSRGTLAAAAAPGIKLGSIGGARTFAGTPAALNKYFSKAGSIKYTTLSNDTGDVSLTTTVSDGKLSSFTSSTISITPVNDAPTMTAPAAFTVTEDVAGNLVWPASPAAFADVDSPSLTVTLAVADGTLTATAAQGITLGGTATARTITGSPADLNGYFKAAGNIKYTTATDSTVARTLATTVSDGTLSASKTSTISITPVNDAPTVSAPPSFSVTEDGAGNLVWPASPAAFADVDSPALTVTLAVADGTLTAKPAIGIKLGNTALGQTFAGSTAALNTYFQTAGNLQYKTAANATADVSLFVGVSDGTLSAFKLGTISITPVNDAPAVTVPTTFTVLKNTASNLIWPTLGSEPVEDIDSESLTVTLAVADGTLTAKPSTDITIGGTATAVTLAGTAGAISDYLRFFGNVQYTTAFDNTVARTLTTTVSDGLLSTSKTSTISINAAAPTVQAPASFTVTEDVAGNLVWPASPAAFADADSPSLTVTLAVADGTLTAVSSPGITLDGPATSRLFIGTPAALNAYFGKAGNIKYTTASDNTVARTLTTTVSDGMLSSSTTSTISITAVNDAPTVAPPASFTVTEDVAGNLVWLATVAAFADIDSPSLTVTLAVADGTLSAATAPGITLGGTATARTFAGTPADLNGYFQTAGNITYTTAADNTVARTLTTTVSDGKLSTSKTSTISITAVNDAPTMTAPASFTVTEDVAGNLVWPASPAAFADVDSPSLTVTLAVADGTLTAAAATGITVGGTDTARTIAGTPAALNGYFKTAGRIKYTTATNNTVARTLTTTISDGTLSASSTSTISITPVNDAPTIWVWNAFGFSNQALSSTQSVIRISEEPRGGTGNDNPSWLDPAWRFGEDPEGVSLLTATFTIDAGFGRLSVRPLTSEEQALAGVTVKSGNVGSTLSFQGTAAALEAFFRDGNNVFYTDTIGAGVKYRLLRASLSDGQASSLVVTWITVS